MKVITKLLICMIFVFGIVSTINAQNNQLAYVKNMETKTYLDLRYDSHHMIHPAEDIYDLSWDNNIAHAYKSVNLPDNFTINLKDFAMPLRNTSMVTSNFGYRVRFKRNHNGIDIQLHTGDTIYATFSGKVRIVKYDKNGYGKYVVIRHYNGLETIYGHMSKQLVYTNQYIKVGKPIGLGGSTGRSTGPHLHLETRFLGLPIDPAKIFDFQHQDVLEDYYTFKKKPDSKKKNNSRN